MRGDGRIYLRPGSSIYQCSFYHRGVQQRESTGETDPDRAQRYLRNRLKEIHADDLGGPQFTTQAQKKLRVDDLLDALKADFEMRGKLSAQNGSAIKKAREAFGGIVALALNADHFDTYIKEQLAEGYANATINRITGMVGQAFQLAVDKRKVNGPAPYITQLSEQENVRQGFASKEQFLRVHAQLPADLQDFALFAFLTGWRKGEIAKMDWSNVQDGDTFIRMRPDQCKNKHGHSVPVVDELAGIIERRRKARTIQRKDGTTTLAHFVFHRGDGAPVRDIRKAWAAACKAAGLPNLLFHDLRRSAVTALVNSGVPQLVAMGLSGHKTPSMFKRYNIKIEAEQIAAMEAVAAYHKRKLVEAEAKAAANVVPMRQQK